MIIDSREHALIELVLRNGKTPTIKTMDVGDIWIGLSGEEIQAGGIIIERKTVSDFEASFLDKRYREQRTRILSVCQERGAKPMYIIEGALHDGRTLKKTAMKKLLFRLALRYGITVYNTESLEDTLNTLEILESQIAEDKESFKTPNSFSYVETVGSAKKDSGDSPHIFAIRCLTACRGISVKSAEALLAALGSLKGVMEAGIDEIAVVKSGSKAIGKAVAGRLKGLF